MMRRLPIQVWKSITYWLGAVEIGKLLCCGDAVVVDKLLKGGVEEINLNWPHSRWIPYPTFISQHVRTLSIKSSLPELICPTMKFETLPTNLRSLLLRFNDLFVLMKRQNVCLSTLVPSLTCLDLEGLCGADSLRDYFLDGLLERLPPQLEHLRLRPQHLDNWHKPPRPAFLRRLPTTLVSLRLEFSIVDDGSTRHVVFPPHLEVLRIRKLRVSDNTDVLSNLPSSLLHLDLTCYRLTNRWTTRPLCVNRSDTKWPPRLQTIQGDDSLALEDLPMLPPTVTDLLLRGIRKEYRDFVTLLPPKLKCVRGAVNGGWTMESVSKLPSSLERTDVLHLDSPASCNLNQHLPNLKRLTIFGYWDNKPLEGFVLPSHLTKLYLPLVSDDICLLLPKTLRSFTARDGTIGDIGAAALSKELEALDFPASSFAHDSVLRHFGHVMRMRLSVSDHPVINLTSHFLEQVEVSANGWKDLEIAYSSDAAPWPIFSEFGRTLIRLTNLERLILAQAGDDLPQGAEPRLNYFRFPPSLRYLYLTTMPTAPTLDEVRLLPPALQHLLLSWWDSVPLSPDAISALPPALHQLDVDHISPLDNIHHLLPPYLYKCEVLQSGFITPLWRLYPELFRK